MTSHFPIDGKEFAGKRTLITGGTKGLGAAMAQRFLSSGGQGRDHGAHARCRR
jgi:NAD(P)-dependent dehydrogenase (short-subunit alcohol dehydrogenase family)